MRLIALMILTYWIAAMPFGLITLFSDNIKKAFGIKVYWAVCLVYLIALQLCTAYSLALHAL